MPNSSDTTIEHPEIIEFPRMGDDDTWINVYQSPSPVPFTIARVFNVYAKEPCERGKHAHRECTQLIVCVAGIVGLEIKDGIDDRQFELNCGEQGILVQPGLWVEVNFLEQNSAIMVLCDQPYDERDYIRSWDDFLQYKGIK